METIKIDGNFSIVKDDKWYTVYKGKQLLKTPGGAVALTMYLPIAEQLLLDWKKQGYNSYISPTSLLSFHFTMVDIFSKFSKQALLEELNSMNW